MSHSSLKAGALLATAVLLTACAASTTSSSGASRSPAAAVGSPAVDLERPVGIVAIGHSGLTGEGTGARTEAVPAKSWATGDDPQVDSVYLRMVALRPETEGHVANTAFGGAPASALPGQAEQALADVPAPALAIVQTVDNDIQCDGANVADVGQSLRAALAVIHDASPSTAILVVGQLGRPSVTFIRKLVAHDPAAKADLTWYDPCSFFEADGHLRVSGVKKLSAVIDAYEAETARVCAAVPHCVTDGGVRKAYTDRIANFSPDYAHLNARGQAAEAELVWPVVEGLLGAPSA